MKVTKEMMDPELWLRGRLMDLLLKKSTEEAFLRSMKRRKKFFRLLEEKKLRGFVKEVHHLERSKGSALRLCLYKPKEPQGLLPGILWLHGGGYAQGAPEMNHALYQSLMEKEPCVIVAPAYTLSTEAPYPAALEDAHLALLYMKTHAKDLGIRDDQLMVGGESAGGGLAAALTHYARDLGSVNIAFQMPLYPMLDDRMDTDSMKENDAPIWDAHMNAMAWKRYLGPLWNKEVPIYAAALRATNYDALPPALTFVVDLDPFRDETLLYMKHLEEAGIPIHLKMLKGAYHGFDRVHPKGALSMEAQDFFLKGFSYAVKNYTDPQNPSP